MSESKMIVRVAHAISLARYRLKKSKTPAGPRDYIVLARAAIKAQREPTDSMVIAGINEDAYGTAAVWRAMNDAALK